MNSVGTPAFSVEISKSLGNPKHFQQKEEITLNLVILLHWVVSRSSGSWNLWSRNTKWIDYLKKDFPKSLWIPLEYLLSMRKWLNKEKLHKPGQIMSRDSTPNERIYTFLRLNKTRMYVPTSFNIVLDYYLEPWAKNRNAKKQNYQIDIYTILNSTVQNTHFLQALKEELSR